ncbi:acyl-CoA dehydrogenase family protein [Rhizohabitans arisaemae]|uniref:acyl-CoA dehydrogenase family protein n=1 Tax=Rhizohabitans arisaemae TaxID=2720610 RepID=UPI0024B14EA1|nr:acyl-CoA dehydrogenase family protein [Rhizohabitans arisaemae]
MIDLTPGQRLLRDTARDFADRELAPYARERDRREELPRSVVGQLAEVGVLGLGLPERYGGVEAGTLSYCLAMEELGRADASVGGMVAASLGLVAGAILRWGAEEQRAAWLPRLASGESVGCFALTEPECGSDVSRLTTRATLGPDGWRITGVKTFITNGTWADVALVFARVDPDQAGPRGVGCFLVPTDLPGFSARPIKNKLGLRAQDVAEVVLEEVRVSRDALLGSPGDGFAVAVTALDRGRISLAAGCVGIARAVLDAALGYTGQRHGPGEPAADIQPVRRLLAVMDVEITAARLLTHTAAHLADRGLDHSLAASRAGLYASEVAVRATGDGVQVFGCNGYIDEFPLERLLRDALMATRYEDAGRARRLLLGRGLTGMSAL